LFDTPEVLGADENGLPEIAGAESGRLASIGPRIRGGDDETVEKKVAPCSGEDFDPGSSAITLNARWQIAGPIHHVLCRLPASGGTVVRPPP